jgi:hypothetical protein
MKNVIKIALGIFVVCLILQSCAGDKYCRTDACYNREISSVDPYKKGDIAAWGTEKETAQQEEAMSKKRFYRTDKNY